MELQHLLIPEFQYEVTLTEKFINRIPEDKMDCRPLPISMRIMRLANHLAEIPQWVLATMDKDELDLHGYKAPDYKSKEDMVKFIRTGASSAEAALRKPEEDYQELWKLRKEEH